MPIERFFLKVIFMRKHLPFLILIATTVLIGCHQNKTTEALEPIRLKGQAQGTYYSIIYYDEQQRNLQPQIDSILKAFDLSASLWVETSNLRRLNAGLTDTLDPILTELFRQDDWLYSHTNGAFSCAVGKLVRAWGFAFDKASDMNQKRVDSLLLATAHNFSITSEGSVSTIERTIAGQEYDFNAIGQGYSVDLISKYLKSLGINNHLIDVGGEVIAFGHKPDGKSWTVGIERPAKDKDAIPEVETMIKLCDCSVVTSGNYRKYYEKNGVRFSHTIDPSTGYPVEHSLLSVSVIANESWLADGLATSFMVMGLDKALEWLKNNPDQPQAVFFIYDDNGSNKTYATPEFQKLIIE